MSEFRPSEKIFDILEARVAVVAARWNGEITDGLLSGAIKGLTRHGIAQNNIEIFRVPGAFELPLASQRAARTGRFSAVISLGCVIRGDTPHFDYVCSETTRGIGQVSLNENLPVAFGLLTTDNLEQSLERSGDNSENKGEEAALTALEMLTMLQKMDGS
ncbi:MAG: 6,7-dimethyl-8-ribityllumazine synthase [Porticoccaceae bacterium]|nr:6,7-dimethyl-8-ribityllumazine synthase [Porticoccaceae bacterium]MDG1749378.1 6,7-dimethyl-8-ribityllumazine synthase [Porticoccaceae bacterium]